MNTATIDRYVASPTRLSPSLRAHHDHPSTSSSRRFAIMRRLLRKRLILVLLLLLTLFIFRIYRPLFRLFFSHHYDIAYAPLLNAQFAVYIMTRSCGRHTAVIANVFPSSLVTLVVDDPSALNEDCEGLGTIFEYSPPDSAGHSNDYMYRHKWAAVMRTCNTGNAIKCLVLEDDIVFIHYPQRTREVLVEQTMTLWNHDRTLYDCAARGFGWLPSTPTGTGSQCRVVPKIGSDRVADCVSDQGWEDGQMLDAVLDWCLGAWRIPVARFLLTQNTGIQSIMDRSSSKPKAGTIAAS